MTPSRLFFLATIATIAGGALIFDVSPVMAIDEPDTEPALRFTVAGGIASSDSYDVIRGTYSVAVSLSTSPCDRSRERIPRWCLDLRVPAWRIPGHWPDPWKKRLPFGGPDPKPSLRLSDLDVGPSWIVTPEIEGRFSPKSRWSPSLFLGTGFVVEDGQTTRMGQEVFRTTRTTSPAVSWGGALTYGFNDRVALRLEARGLTAFMGQMQVFGPGEQQFTAEGGNVTTLFSSAGLTFNF